MDTFPKKIRSEIMSKVSSSDTKPELIVRKFLFSRGFRYRKNDKKLPGKPDIVLPKYKTVIFVHGCFWHMHGNCKHADLPKSNVEYWTEKICRNVKRDLENHKQLAAAGWKIIVVWECELKGSKRETTLLNLVDNIIL